MKRMWGDQWAQLLLFYPSWSSGYSKGLPFQKVTVLLEIYSVTGSRLQISDVSEIKTNSKYRRCPSLSFMSNTLFLSTVGHRWRCRNLPMIKRGLSELKANSKTTSIERRMIKRKLHLYLQHILEVILYVLIELYAVQIQWKVFKNNWWIPCLTVVHLLCLTPSRHILSSYS